MNWAPWSEWHCKLLPLECVKAFVRKKLFTCCVIQFKLLPGPWTKTSSLNVPFIFLISCLTARTCLKDYTTKKMSHLISLLMLCTGIFIWILNTATQKQSSQFQDPLHCAYIFSSMSMKHPFQAKTLTLMQYNNPAILY